VRDNFNPDNAMNRAFSGIGPWVRETLRRCLRLELNSAPLALKTPENVRDVYCTVTSVPTGISEKNFRAVSSGNRMQPCDAG
jgi:hypothetical protein